MIEGDHNIYYNQPSDFTKPDEIYINGNKLNNHNSLQHFNNEEDSAILIWINPITNCSQMFKNCECRISLILIYL